MQWALERKEREPTKVHCFLLPSGSDSGSAFLVQLSLWVDRWDEGEGKEVHHPGSKHVRTLWGMDRGKRVQVWRTLGRYDELEVLELGGEAGKDKEWREGTRWVEEGIKCPLDVDELSLMLPDRHIPLAGLRELRLHRGLSELNKSWLRALVRAGCGPNLTSLSLWREEHSWEEVEREHLNFMSNGALRVLAAAGCGTSLTSLSLRGECFSCSQLFMLDPQPQSQPRHADQGCGVDTEMRKSVLVSSWLPWPAAAAGLVVGFPDASVIFRFLSDWCSTRRPLHSCVSPTGEYLAYGVTDEGVRALARAGWGASLTSLHLESGCFLLFVFFLDICPPLQNSGNHQRRARSSVGQRTACACSG